MQLLYNFFSALVPTALVGLFYCLIPIITGRIELFDGDDFGTPSTLIKRTVEPQAFREALIRRCKICGAVVLIYSVILGALLLWAPKDF